MIRNDPDTRFDFYHITFLVHCIVDNCPWTYYYSLFSRQSDTPEDNADPVGDTTIKGCYTGGSTLYSR